MSRAPKLNATQRQRLRDRRASGASFEELAAEFGVSRGSAHAYAKASASTASKAGASGGGKLGPAETRGGGKKPRKGAPAPAVEPSAPPTIEELRQYLGDQVRSLRTDIASAKEASAKASANRALVTVQTLLTRITPSAPPDPTVGVYVEAGAMKKLGAEVAARLHKMIDIVAARSSDPEVNP